MAQSRPLALQLKSSLDWHQSRINLMALVIMGLIQTSSVNLAKIARTMGHGTQLTSRHKRLKRFFAQFDLPLDDIARLVVHWMAPEGRWILCLDRTNWEFGQFKINILMLAIAYRGTAIPVVWTLLPKAGMSNTDERIALLERFVALFGTERIEYLAADREFRGGNWLKWLNRHHIAFRIRIPNDTRVMNRQRTAKLKAYRYFSLSIGEHCTLNGAREMWGVSVYLSCYRSDQERIIIISNTPCETSLSDYLRRWEIESLFQSLKGRGFDLESTRLKDRDRVSRLLGVLTLAYCWCYSAGVWRERQTPIKTLKHNRPANSVFRYGMQWLASLLFDPTGGEKQLRWHIRYFGRHHLASAIATE